MNRNICIAACLLALCVCASQAQSVSVGAGAVTTCSQWSTARQMKPVNSAQLGMLSWIQGYLSGLNQGRVLTDDMRDLPDGAVLALAVDNACLGKPTDELWTIALALDIKLARQQGKRQ